VARINNFMKKDESELIWEAYTSPGRVGGGNIPFPDGRGEMDNQPDPEQHKDEHGRPYIFRGPKDGAFDSIQQVTQAHAELRRGLGQLFQPSKEGSYYVLEPSDEFKSYGSDGDGMGGTIEHDLGDCIVGLADGNFLEYIKYPPPEEEDPDSDLFHQTENDYRRSEGL